MEKNKLETLPSVPKIPVFSVPELDTPTVQRLYLEALKIAEQWKHERKETS